MIFVQRRFFYLYMFFLACVAFWWSPSIVLAFKGVDGFIKTETLLLSILAFGCFAVGYTFFSNKYYPLFTYPLSLLKKVNIVSRTITLLFSAPALLCAVLFFITRSALTYGEGDGVPLLYQAFFYAQLSFFFVYISTCDEEERKSNLFWAIIIVTIAIRLIVSLQWGRFFLVQAVFPIFIVFAARKWIVFSLKNIVAFLLVGAFVVLAPAYFRGDFNTAISITDEIDFDKVDTEGASIEYMKASSTLKLFEDNKDDDYSNYCNPLVVSLTQKVVPYALLDMCVMDIWREKALATTMDRILAYKELGHEASQEVLAGPGSNYLIESYVSLYGVFGIVVVSFVFGVITAISFNSLTTASLFGSIWLEILTRGVLIPRGNVGYALERVPMLLLTTLVFILLTQFFFKTKNAA